MGSGAGNLAALDFEIFSRGHPRAELGESACWDPATNAVWWVDISGQRLLRTNLGSGETAGWATPETIGFVVLLGSDAPAVGMESGIFRFDPATNAFDRMLALDGSGQRCNDAIVDARGRLWASTMAQDAVPGRGAIHRVTPQLVFETWVDGLTIPNGIALDLERGRMLYSDSHRDVQTIWSRPLDASGLPAGNASVFATTTGLDGRPDGASLDADGNYWIAGVDGSALYVFDREGALIDTLPVPSPAPTKICFCGPDGRQAIVTSKDIGEQGGYLARASLPPTRPAGTVQPYWNPEAS